MYIASRWGESTLELVSQTRTGGGFNGWLFLWMLRCELIFKSVSSVYSVEMSLLFYYNNKTTLKSVAIQLEPLKMCSSH